MLYVQVETCNFISGQYLYCGCTWGNEHKLLNHRAWNNRRCIHVAREKHHFTKNCIFSCCVNLRYCVPALAVVCCVSVIFCIALCSIPNPPSAKSSLLSETYFQENVSMQMCNRTPVYEPPVIVRACIGINGRDVSAHKWRCTTDSSSSRKYPTFLFVVQVELMSAGVL